MWFAHVGGRTLVLPLSGCGTENGTHVSEVFCGIAFSWRCRAQPSLVVIADLTPAEAAQFKKVGMWSSTNGNLQREIFFTT